jgi:5'(3')-deoxyribonucleotidase
MDGVIANFVQGISDHHGLPNPYTKKESLGIWDTDYLFGMTTGQFWEGVDENFWAALEPTPEAIYIIKSVLECVSLDKIHVATVLGGGRFYHCVDGKLSWMEKHFPKLLSRMWFGVSDKACFASGDTLLIDDSDRNCAAFNKAGGHVILFPRPWNSNHDYGSLTYLAAELQHFFPESFSETTIKELYKIQNNFNSSPVYDVWFENRPSQLEVEDIEFTNFSTGPRKVRGDGYEISEIKTKILTK